MKKLKYLLLPVSAGFNAFIAFLAMDSSCLWGIVRKVFPAPSFTSFEDLLEKEKPAKIFEAIIVVIATLMGIALTVFCIKALLGCFEKLSKKALLWTACASVFVAVATGVGVYHTQNSKANWLFCLLSALMLAALYVLITAFYRALKAWFNGNSQVGTVLSLLFGVLCLPMVFVAVSCVKLASMATVDDVGIYGASIAVSALLFLFGVVALVGAFVKKQRFLWIRPAAAMLLVVVLCVSVLTVFVTGLSSGTDNFIKNAALDIGMIRLGLSDREFVCAYEGNGGERIYLLKTELVDDAELSEILECVKIGGDYHRTVNGVEYEHIRLDFFSSYYVFTVIPA